MEPITASSILPLLLRSSATTTRLLKSYFKFDGHLGVDDVKRLSSSDQPSQIRHFKKRDWLSKLKKNESTLASRAVYDCLDSVYSFLAAAEQKETAFFSVRLQSREGRGHDTAVLVCHNIQLSSKSSEGEAFAQARTFVNAVRQLAEIDEQDSDHLRLIAEANVMDSPLHQREDAENGEIISMAILTANSIIQLAGKLPDGSFIKVLPGNMPLILPPGDLVYIKARWREYPSQCYELASKVRDVLDDSTKEYRDVAEVLRDISLETETKNVVFIGSTGSGKSHSARWLVNLLGGRSELSFQTSNSSSMTTQLDYVQLGDIRVWDTPGLNDSYNRDDEFLGEIERHLMDMGFISAVVLCFNSIMRITASERHTIDLYSGILGEVADRLIIFVNGQATSVNNSQRQNLIRAMARDARIKVGSEQVFDMGPKCKKLQQNCDAALGLLRMYCNRKPLRAGPMDRLVKGLEEIQTLCDDEAIASAKEKLLFYSAEALRKRLVGASRRHPLRLCPTLGTSLVLSDGRKHRLAGNEPVIIEHHLEIPRKITRNVLDRMNVVLRGVMLKGKEAEEVINIMKKFRLVFRSLPADQSHSKRNGVFCTVVKLSYRLWSVDEALSDDVRSFALSMMGEDRNRYVTVFKSIREHFEAE